MGQILTPLNKAAASQAPKRLQLYIRGAVQGVGFRPFVYGLAQDLALTGWINNSNHGVAIEVEGPQELLDAFLLRLESDKPPLAAIHSLEPALLDPVGFEGFEIRPSDEAGTKSALILPDIATCAQCREEIFTPGNRRFRYPFTNCTNCGPRFSIIKALPYDRGNTTMEAFVQCPQCQTEYQNPLDRRFHAQPNACPHCGPSLELWGGDGQVLHCHHDALLATAKAIGQGAIAAIKGLGGFHLMADARNQAAIARLRLGKHRDEKPLALIYPSLEQVAAHCQVSALEARLLQAPEAPITLLNRRQTCSDLAANIAPRNPYLGIMLPYTPLHHLLLAELNFPLVATSGNISDEPICTDEYEALQRLGSIADLFLVHNRPIKRRLDDSIVRLVKGRELVLRRARGYAPLPIALKAPTAQMLAVGGHLKNTVAVSLGQQAFTSQHIGDLATEPALKSFYQTLKDLPQLYALTPEAVACDQHPDYLSTQWAHHSGLPLIPVQHHHAHVLSCMAENQLDGPVLGVSWDGSGYGPDQTIWGGEFLRTDAAGYQRVAHWRPFPLPGGEKAVKEPRRSALGLLYALWGEPLFEAKDLPPLAAFGKTERSILKRMLAKGLNTPRTSSVGRLFDAVASIIDLRQKMAFEGQAAMELEFKADNDITTAYPLALTPSPDNPNTQWVDWAPMIGAILADMNARISLKTIAARFHNTLAASTVAVAQLVGIEQVVLTGGCFQNKRLTEFTVDRLLEAGFRPYWHQRIPPNDGGIALGQLVAAGQDHTTENTHVPGHTR